MTCGRTEGRGDNFKAVVRYKELVEIADGLWDVFAQDPKRRTECVKQWGVSMSESEHRYYEDQKGPRLMECDKGVDPVWYAAMMKKQGAKEIEEQYREERDNLFAFKDLDTISNMVNLEAVVVTDIDTSVER